MTHISVLILLSLILTLISFVTCIPNHHPKIKFHWSASLNTDTGIANSYESSIIETRTTSKKMHNIFSYYPNFLSLPSVSLGLLRTEDTTTTLPKSKDDDDIINIRDSIFGLNLLSFGKPKFMKDGSSQQKLWKEHSNDSNSNEHDSGTMISSGEFPIVGGLLSSSFTSSSSKSSSLSSTSTIINKSSIKEKQQQTNGCMRFSIRKLPSSLSTSSMKSSSPSSISSSPSSIYQLETGLVDYIPAMSGRRQKQQKMPKRLSSSSSTTTTTVSSSLPSNNSNNNNNFNYFIRSTLYRSTQTFVHAYVMRRYHGYVKSKLIQLSKEEDKEEKITKAKEVKELKEE